jgi:hypothetical protein
LGEGRRLEMAGDHPRIKTTSSVYEFHDPVRDIAQFRSLLPVFIRSSPSPPSGKR